MKKLINLTMFDLFKGVAMLFVLFGHSVVYSSGSLSDFWWGKILLSLLMPAFFLVSGYWLKKKKISVGIKSSFDYLCKPFIIFVVILLGVSFLHRMLSGNINEWVQVFLIPTLLVSTKSGSRIGPMWFVFALFLAWSLFYLIINIKNEKIHTPLAILLGILGGALMPLKLPYQIAQGLVAFFFVYCGYLVKKKKLLEKKLHPVFYVLMVIVWGVTVVFGSMDLHDYSVRYGMFSMLGSLCGAFLLIKLFLYLNLLEWNVLDGIRWIGRYSMWVVVIHAIENAVFPWKILLKFVEPCSVLGIGAHFILRLIGIIIACFILQKVQMFLVRKQKDE